MKLSWLGVWEAEDWVKTGSVSKVKTTPSFKLEADKLEPRTKNVGSWFGAFG